MSEQTLSTHEKALRINLDATKHGTFAEIGAGQEVVRWFFHVGGAAGTVAKTISAYDMAISDALYGKSDRYVSRSRLGAMLDSEYSSLVDRLGQARGASTSFFAFADTMAAHSFKHPGVGQGWMGIRFQMRPGAAPSEIILHVRMLDAENARQQEAVGILGVNLVFGALYYESQHQSEPVNLVRALGDGLVSKRLEVDMIRFSGRGFEQVDNRLMILELVELGLADAAIFTAEGESVEAGEILHAKPVVLERGSFRPMTSLSVDILDRAERQLSQVLSDETPVALMEMSVRDLDRPERLDHRDFLDRADILGVLGRGSMISRYGQHHRVAGFLRRYTSRPIAFAMGTPALQSVFDQTYYQDLDGGLLEGIGLLFKSGVALYVHPSRDAVSQRTIGVEDLRLSRELSHLYRFLIESGRIIEMEMSPDDIARYDLTVRPREVLAKIRSGDPSWEALLPDPAVAMIKTRRLFGYRGS